MKNNYYYSFTEKGFYWLSEDELNDSTVPTDLVPISEDVHAALMFGQESGKYISHTPAGPILIDQPDYSPEELIAQAESKKEKLLSEAEVAIAPLARAVKLKIATDEEIALLEAWELYSVMVNRVDISDPEWPEVPGVA
ncbi:tail fiber assembly protein [Salmonella enterica]|uniref:Tail fiber assembly protein n=1 Tax=Salmonella enterica TaxID=28901 RepID=A0A5U6SWJ5_SALER|nr:tail fiber assembly protein [Salmonella enterica]EAW1966360.1 tail fiber assembly protein [Salmonella enterica subsp. enterica]EBW0152449.1 tail fiber assembly protein [Salmonella enterica subsp. enterica serovar Norwich]ECS5679945.1 tail fiber assembly protein [Salmonella enterica subsp. enterica serovar Bareilly]EAN6218062.1 tail fiber assembly protein [Salmonella enterica]EAP7999688.1 tail fiber assembly protein [Salmonella enterica]